MFLQNNNIGPAIYLLGAKLNRAYILHVSAVVKFHFWIVLSGSVNRDLLEHLPFGILQRGIEDFIE